MPWINMGSAAICYAVSFGCKIKIQNELPNTAEGFPSSIVGISSGQQHLLRRNIDWVISRQKTKVG